ncbi:MAG: glycosyltransferase [Cyanobium sp.]
MLPLQTYGPKELIIVDDDPDTQLPAVIAATGSSQIRHVRLPDEGLNLGALRNIALDHALGVYICQWDDDDLHDPVRLEVQWRTLHSCGAQASVLARWMIWWPRPQRLAVSCYRDWEGSLLCERSLMPRYPECPRGEDSHVLEHLRQTVRLVRIDLPRLYLYICHGANTFETDHFEHHWQQASVRWCSGGCVRLELELDRRLPLLRTRDDLADAATRPRQAAAALSSSSDPRVLILTPVRNGKPHIHRYRTLLERLNFDPDRLSIAWLEGDSVDDSHACLERLHSC